MAKEYESTRLARRAAEICQERKCTYVTVLDVRKHTPFVDYFVIATTQNRIQSEAVVDALREGIDGYHHREGKEGAEWILVDFRDIAVHVMLPEAHRFYDLERLWGDAPRLPIEQAAAVPQG